MIQALWHENKKTSSLREVIWDKNRSKDIHVRSLYSMISLGTERTICLGNLPPQLSKEMNVPYMEGDIRLPVKYGYSLVGEIINKNHSLEGRLVHLLHPHQSNCRVKEAAISLIPTGIPPLRATLASNMETAINAIWDSSLAAGDQVLVLGYGLIGALIAQLAVEHPGTNVYVIEKNANRKNLAQERGFETSENIPLGSFDLAFNTTGNASGLQLGIDAVGTEGKVIELSWYGDKETRLRLGHDFHWKRKKIISSQVSVIPSTKAHRWDYARRKALVFELLKNPIFDTFITKIIPFALSPDFFHQLRTKEINDIGVCIKY